MLHDFRAFTCSCLDRATCLLSGFIDEFLAVPAGLSLCVAFVWTFVILMAAITLQLDAGVLIRVAIASLISLTISTRAYARKSLSKSGALAAVVVGFIITLSSFAFSACLLSFFFIGTKATKFRADRKRKIEADYVKNGQRSAIQVLANGGTAVIFAVLYVLEVGPGEISIYYGHDFFASSYICAFVAAVACSCGDTLSSEFGTVLGSEEPRLITTFQKVPRGTNGGVSLEGFVASLLGGTVIGLVFYLATAIALSGYDLQSSPPQWPVILLGAFSGLFGSIIDSYLGALFQFSGLDEENRVVNYAHLARRKITGRELLDNHMVNFLSTVITALAAQRFAYLLWSFVPH